ncbi:hypothetical protein [Streptomyces anulatus]|uniref:hypothetical protein n=1 Tax=Streptomyces anulatus TaxID=1892 RepID=UPI003F4D0388
MMSQLGAVPRFPAQGAASPRTIQGDSQRAAGRPYGEAPIIEFSLPSPPLLRTSASRQADSFGSGRQTLHLLIRRRRGAADACLAAGFSVGTMTAHRHFRGAVDLLAAHTPTSEQVMTKIRKAYAILGSRMYAIDATVAEVVLRQPEPVAP